jgi:hypothetical protein
MALNHSNSSACWILHTLAVSIFWKVYGISRYISRGGFTVSNTSPHVLSLSSPLRYPVSPDLGAVLSSTRGSGTLSRLLSHPQCDAPGTNVGPLHSSVQFQCHRDCFVLASCCIKMTALSFVTPCHMGTAVRFVPPAVAYALLPSPCFGFLRALSDAHLPVPVSPRQLLSTCPS